MRAHGPQDGGVDDDMRNAQHGNRCEPHHRYRAKKLANTCGAPLLHHKKAKQNDQGEWNHIFLERG